MKDVQRCIGFAAALALLACGGQTPSPGEDEIVTSDWQRVDREYPYVGEAGELVCNEWRRRAPEGFIETEQEYYHLEKINDKLEGRIGLDEGARGAIRAAGITRVQTCEAARAFMRLQHEYFESFPSSEPGPTPGTPTTEVPTEETPGRVDKVRDGHLQNHGMTVRVMKWSETQGRIVKTCSGVLLNKFAILTSAHCFANSGFYPVSVDYGVEMSAMVASDRWCISSNSPNCLTVMPSPNNFRVYRNPDYSGTADTKDDAAVLVEWDWDPWRVIGDNTDYYMRLTYNDVGAGLSFWVQGYGANAHDGSGVGTPRRSNQMEGISWVGAGYWLSYATAGYGHPCLGDSGSSAVNVTKTPWDVSIGISSNFEQVGNNACPQIGDKFRYTGLNSANFSLISAALADSASPPCFLWGYNGWLYKACF